jgi:hypothetical protein
MKIFVEILLSLNYLALINKNVGRLCGNCVVIVLVIVNFGCDFASLHVILNIRIRLVVRSHLLM